MRVAPLPCASTCNDNVVAFYMNRQMLGMETLILMTYSLCFIVMPVVQMSRLCHK